MWKGSLVFVYLGILLCDKDPLVVTGKKALDLNKSFFF